MKIVALAGGVGGAKLAEGLAQVLPPDDLTVVVNTGDDFRIYGLYVSPDLDTVCYTLAGLNNPATGWGRRDETWNAVDNAARLGGPGWFRIGDQDFGTHLERTRRLKEGQALSQITADFCRAWGIPQRVIPMSDEPISTIVETVEHGNLPFQNYFVEHGCQPRVSGFHFEGVDRAKPAPGVLPAIEQADLVVICPSNPWVSINPILAVPGLRDAIAEKPVIAVSPIIEGKVIKGPAAKMFAELGIHPSAKAVADHYGSLLAGFVLDQADQNLVEAFQGSGIIPLTANTIMVSAEDRKRVAQEVIGFGDNIRRSAVSL